MELESARASSPVPASIVTTSDSQHNAVVPAEDANNELQNNYMEVQNIHLDNGVRFIIYICIFLCAITFQLRNIIYIKLVDLGSEREQVIG